jgi:hypothetical protein
MRRTLSFSLLFFSLMILATACEDDSIARKDDGASKLETASDAMMLNEGNRNFRTHLSIKVNGVDSKAQGQAIFQLSKDGTYISYKLILANIENVTMAHIHLIANTNTPPTGPPVVWLYPAAPPAQLIPGRIDGVFAEGVITSDKLVGSLGGKTLTDLLEAMESGQTYVNVHTLQNGGGEIRGDI